jgi:hypothetical protein
LRAVGANRDSFLTVVDAQYRALANADAFGHAHIDQKQQTSPLEHLSGVALQTIVEENGLMLVALHQMSHAERRRVAG